MAWTICGNAQLPQSIGRFPNFHTKKLGDVFILLFWIRGERTHILTELYFFVVLIFTEDNNLENAYKILDIIKGLKSNHILDVVMIRSAILPKESIGLKTQLQKTI